MKGTHETIAALAAVSFTLAIGCATPAAMEPTQQWSQTEATNLASELVSRIEKARAIANRQTVQADQMESVYSYLNGLQTMESQARRLQAALQAGKGYKDTLWIYEEIKEAYKLIESSSSWKMIELELGGPEASIAASLRQLGGLYGTR